MIVYIPYNASFERETTCPVGFQTLIKRYEFRKKYVVFGFYQGEIKYRLVIPKASMRFELLRTYHNSIAAAHPGIQKMYVELADYYY